MLRIGSAVWKEYMETCASRLRASLNAVVLRRLTTAVVETPPVNGGCLVSVGSTLAQRIWHVISLVAPGAETVRVVESEHEMSSGSG